MRLHYQSKDGEQKSIELTEKPMTIGRSADADVMLLDEKSSRVHCGIRFWDGAFFVKDLKSKNGTFVNDKRIDIHQLVAGDRIRIGGTVFLFEQGEETAPGANTAIQEMQGAFDGGKGYSTLLREIVEESAEAPAPSPEGGRGADEGMAEDEMRDRPTVPESARKKVVRKKKTGGSPGGGDKVTRLKIKRPGSPPAE